MQAYADETARQIFLLALHFCSIPSMVNVVLQLTMVRLTHIRRTHACTPNLGQRSIKISTKSCALPWRCNENNSNEFWMLTSLCYTFHSGYHYKAGPQVVYPHANAHGRAHTHTHFHLPHAKMNSLLSISLKFRENSIVPPPLPFKYQHKITK